MNKYQEALNELVSYYDYDDYPKILQELVDKTIPKKPIREIWGWDCPSCGKYVAYYPKKTNGADQNDVYVFLETCPNHDCRQAIDWSNELKESTK